MIFHLSYTLCKFLLPKKPNSWLYKFHKSDPIVIFYRNSSFVSDVLSELKLLNSYSTEFHPFFRSFSV